jgi:hypothetical protein
MERRDVEFSNLDRIAEQLVELELIKDYVAISGGMAWHLMSPPHHELKALHDHKDLDLFVIPEHFQTVVAILKGAGYEKTWTKYDGVSKDFYRYTKYGEFKVMLDLFVESVPSVKVGEFRVVEPAYLLTLYRSKHTSDYCTAVQAATRLLARGVSPIGKKELVGSQLSNTLLSEDGPPER